MKMYKVLLIDDEPSALEAMQLWIDWQALGFEIAGTCTNGQAGLQLIRELAPDLVITDVNMPLLNGLEMVDAWQQTGGRDTKFAILSGYSEFEYAQTAIRFGIHHYLLKPLFPEEAADELREMYRELEREEHSRKMGKLAALEETAAVIKGLLYGKPEGTLDGRSAAALSAGFSYWNVLLIQTDPLNYTEVRGEAAVLSAGEAGMVLADLEAYTCAIVYGSTASGEGNATAARIAEELRQACPGIPLFITAGDSVAELGRIAGSYRTAKEALQYCFYSEPSARLLMFHDIRDKPLSRDYDHIRLADVLIGFVNTLDLPGFRREAEAAASSFREKLVSPDTVKKFVIHLVYKMKELVPAPEAGQLQRKGTEPPADFNYHMLTLGRLIEYLLAFAEEVIRLLLQERGNRSQDVVRDINRYIQEHYRESLTIQRLAEIFYLHPVYLGQLLIKKNGIGFNELLHNLRIEEAARLLEERTLKLSEIAERVGYANYGQFLKQFEKKMHLSPNEYRQAKS
ncbi:two-component system response regulator YesN [Paenibacillus sp. PastF-1]|nr:two-component system response regulator YesN [Paenibacillus sp. PastF-2]MDF9850908.1 two-component system response regulator YesN [Paenibacillus sp. PastM-2]MDF9857478.1 two-component system response regulator YesN [Paenibacillus sp. PastF-1]MDH6482746.1 two-component system response regulator YesN [Paenibacillus sp. PastH-2]MDH6510172.1 two-component system response regulator YesN [Paenibacillus sp. PastM-3]